jgi:hypothetical protein
MTRKDDTPFTIVDGVPRELLAKSLKSSAREQADSAKSKLTGVLHKHALYASTPDRNDYRALPDVALLRRNLEEAGRAIAEYESQLAIASRAWEQAEQLLEPAEVPVAAVPVPEPVAAGGVSDGEDDSPTVVELRAKVTAKGPWFEVELGTRAAQCRSCRTTPLYWIVTANGKKLLVDCDVQGGWRPGSEGNLNGRGVAHFATCPDAKMWSKR